MPNPVSVYHHTGLESSGGATRVARLLMEGLTARRIETNISFELGEGADAAAILPEDFGRYLPRDAVPHVHCTGNWPALLDSLPPGRRTVFTLHDCELFTGGCPYPLGCAHLETDCADQCPRNFPDANELRHQKQKLLERLSPELVAPSRWMAKLIKAHLFQTATIIPNGIPWPERPRRKLHARRELGINPAARVALFVAHGGMGAAYKSGQEWRRIWEGIKARLPEALCFAVGGDSAGRDGDLVIWPYVERERLELLMSAADVLLYPTKADNHSLVVLEAMSCALPVVAFDVGGIPEQVADNETGLLVPAGELDAFVDTAATLLADPSRCRDLGQTGFSMGSSRFTAARMVEDYLKLYEQVG